MHSSKYFKNALYLLAYQLGLFNAGPIIRLYSELNKARAEEKL